MDPRLSYTLGHFPPEDAWGVFSRGTCPDLGGTLLRGRYEKYGPMSDELWGALLTVQSTFVTLRIVPRPGFIFPTYEEVLSWENGGEVKWKEKNGLDIGEIEIK